MTAHGMRVQYALTGKVRRGGVAPPEFARPFAGITRIRF
jgi:hypothetical protein